MGKQEALSRAQLEYYRNQLSNWQAPQDFICVADELRAKLGDVQFHTDPVASNLGRNAWVATRLACVSLADAVRLGRDQWPDYEARIGQTIQQYEITEADMPGRRRGDEYKSLAARSAEGPILKPDPVENWIARAEQAPIALRLAAKAKAKKGYPRSARLVIYLNIGEYDIRHNEIEAAMPDSTVSAREAFSQVWVLWKQRLYLVWSHGVQERLVVPVVSPKVTPSDNIRLKLEDIL